MRKYLPIAMFLCLMCAVLPGCDSAGTQKVLGQNGGIDVDLSVMSSVLAAAEFKNITTNPDAYVGKTVKMSGLYNAVYYDKTNQYYHAVVLEGADACCVQGLEFVWQGNHAYPDDYPVKDAKIEVVGVFGSYEELGETFYNLTVDGITVLP
ncbi:MAG: hypothetical protein FWF88_07240 [Peptococcaceae bacterium]|jgi:hypothetical protein|nr:hypothetical protein [Peptococcaceae bacterium]MDR2736811.1 hypothetical protein [Gracilibacteraceae bacterium]